MIRNKRLLPLIVLLVLITPFLSAQSSTQPDSGTILFAKGVDLFKQGMYTESADAFHAIFEKEGKRELGIDAAYLEVLARVNAAEFAKAQELADVFLASFPESEYKADLLYQRGRIAFQSGDYQEAIARFTHFMETQAGSPLLSSALFWRAESLYLLGRTKDAFEEYTRLASEYPDSPKLNLAQWRLELIGVESRAGVLKRIVDFDQAQGLQRLEDTARADFRMERDLEREHLLIMTLRSLYGFAGSWRMPLYAEKTVIETVPPRAPPQSDPALTQASAKAAMEMAKVNRLKELLAAKNAALELLARTLLAFAEGLTK
ncbi:MAG: tetratricopeptide repeat protein [Spirochaetes bacterium]|nr:tetratricopeptide repeat protein [Spirochaetota bacterium]